MNSIKAVIFDLDGVICSTDEYHYLAWKALSNDLGIPFDRNVNKKLRGVSRMDSLEIILGNLSSKFTHEEKISMAEKKNRIYQSYLETITPADLSKDTRMTLNLLRERSYLLAIGSSSKNTRYILQKLGLGDFFDAVVDGTQITHSKPDPEVFLLAASLLGIEPQNAIIVEDSLSGVEAAAAGGFWIAGLLDASHDPKTNYPLTKLSDIIAVL